MAGLRRLLLVFGCVVAGVLVFGGAGAWASVSSFGLGVGDESGQFENPVGIAVDQESGDVYVGDLQNSRIDKFGSGGEFLLAWGWGVGDGQTRALQTCTTSCFEGFYGAGAGQLYDPRGVAVDNDPLSASHGDVYVMDGTNNRVQKFDSSGSFLLAFGGEVNETTNGDVCLAGEACRAGTPGSGPGQFEMGGTGGIAVDASGNVFVGDVNRVEEFTPGGVYVGQVSIPGAGLVKALAVTPGDDVYVHASELAGVHEYELSGAEVGAPRDTTGSFSFFARDFLALGSSGELFVAESEGVVHVREYDSSGGEVASFDRVTHETEDGRNGIAFNPVAGAVDVLGTEHVWVVGVPAAGPLIVSAAGGEVLPTSVAVEGLVNPEGHETTYHVEYGTTSGYGSSTTPATLAGGEFEDEPVSVPLAGLQPATTYHFRVVASNSAGTTVGEDETFTTLPPALVEDEAVSDVTATGVRVSAQLNPLGRDTTYHVEYGPTAGYGSSAPVPDADAGAGTGAVPVNVLVQGLSAGTVYHYRVVAHNALGTAAGPDQVFTTPVAQAPALPDGRAWEMVSPPQKNGAVLQSIGRSGADIQAAADGDAIAYGAQGPVGTGVASNRNSAVSEVMSKRTGAGWTTADIMPPYEDVSGAAETPDYRLFSPDLSAGLVEPQGVTPLSPQATEKTPYLREAGGEYMPLLSAANVPPGVSFAGAFFAGASSDLAHVVVSSAASLTVGVAPPEPGHENLFEWFDGGLRLVSVLPGSGKAVTEEGGTAKLGLHTDTYYGNPRHAVSADGSRVVWEADMGGEVALYVRDLTRGETVRLDVVQPGAHGSGPAGERLPIFFEASADGSKVFFADASRLTSDATGTVPNLYMCELVEVAGRLGCRLKDLSVDLIPGEAAAVQGTMIGSGEDGRYVYFAAAGVLAAGATPTTCGNPGSGLPDVHLSCNLYMYDTTTSVARFIARLSARDYQDWVPVYREDLRRLSAGVSPDGRYLAFMSERSLTGYDNIDARSGQPDAEVYLYDAVTGRLVCASCNPSGARPQGVFDQGGSPGLLVDQPEAWGGHWLAGSLPGWTSVSGNGLAYYRSRYLSNSGRLFFDSPDALVSGDGNGQEDVYEYEPAGVGGCTSAPACVGLVSSGTSSTESAFVDASESGNDVFFLTSAQLWSQDVDHALDLYDARVCSSGSPCLSSPGGAPAACVTADACRGTVASQPGVFGAPSSATFSGAGNPSQGPGSAVVRKRTLTVAQKRAAALRRCRSMPRRRRRVCEAQVRRRYRVGVKAKRSGGSPRKGNG